MLHASCSLRRLSQCNGKSRMKGRTGGPIGACSLPAPQTVARPHWQCRQLPQCAGSTPDLSAASGDTSELHLLLTMSSCVTWWLCLNVSAMQARHLWPLRALQCTLVGAVMHTLQSCCLALSIVSVDNCSHVSFACNQTEAPWEGRPSTSAVGRGLQDRYTLVMMLW